MKKESSLIICIAPNVGEQMGGEAIKALQIYQSLKKERSDSIQITHERCEAEINRLRLQDVHFVRDTWFSLMLWRSVLLRSLLDYWFSWKAVSLAERLAEGRRATIYQTEPNSPVSPRKFSSKNFNVLGPINGNIYYPPAFREHESTSARVRRLLHMPLQVLNRYLFRGILKADLILVAGGARTEDSLFKRGCSLQQMKMVIDCGINQELIQRPRIEQQGENLRFVHFGRLVFHKGTALIIKSLTKTRYDIVLDIVGRGPELENCKALTEKLGLTNRVRFLDWYERHDQLLDSLGQYRGLVLPSIEDANGIVVQEAMALGLAPICLDWGGPQLLIEHMVSGFLVDPSSEDHITSEIASYMDLLASDGEKADAVSQAARKAAATWIWKDVIRDWIASFPGEKAA